MTCGSDLMKKILFLLFFLFLFSFVFSLSFELSQGSFTKGEFFDVNGFSSGSVNIFVSAFPGEKKVFEAVVQPDENNFFFFRRFIPCTDPLGDWTISFFDSNETIEKMFNVKSSVKCEYLRVNFIDPSSSSYYRTEKFDVRVKITDAGKNVENAEAYFWDFNGNKKRLYNQGNGIYFFEDIGIPVDAEIKEFELMVTAVSGTKEKNGGSNKVSFEVRSVPITLEVIKPAVREFNFGQSLEIIVKPVYPDGSLAFDAVVRAEYNSEKYTLKEKENGEHYIIIATEDLNAEIFYVNLLVEDAFGNTGSLSLNLEPKGHLYYIIAQNAIVYVFPVLFIIYVIFVSFKEGRTFVNRLLLKRKRKKLLILMKKLQDDYFNKQLIARTVYLEQYDDYKHELDGIEQKIYSLEKKQEIR